MSLPNDISRIADSISSAIGSSTEYDGDKREAARTLVRRSILFPVAAVFANGAGTSPNIVPNASPVQWRAPANIRVLGVTLLPTGAVVQHASNNANFAIKKLAAGATGATIATANTNTVANGGTGTLAAGVEVAIGLVSNLANTRVAEGTIIAPAVDQNASGVLTVAATIQVDYELEGPYADYPV